MAKTKTKHIEFSKILTIVVIVIFAAIAIWSMIEYYFLIKLSIDNCSTITPDVSLPVTCITTILGTLLSYCLYQSILKSSLNKNQLKVDKITGEVKSIQNEELMDTVQKYAEDCDYQESDKEI